MAWWFWMMKQLNGCSTPAPRFSGGKQWIERTGWNNNDDDEIKLAHRPICFWRSLWRQALVETLSLLGVTRHINKFLCEVAQKVDSGFAIHTSGFHCNWLKKVILEVIIFLVLYSLSLCCWVIPCQAIQSYISDCEQNPWIFISREISSFWFQNILNFFNRTSIRKAMPGWYLQCSHLIFAYIFVNLVLWHKNPCIFFVCDYF